MKIFLFFEDMSDTDILEQKVSEENVKKYYIQSFLRAVEGKKIFNEEVEEEIKQNLRDMKKQSAVDDEINRLKIKKKWKKPKRKKLKKKVNHQIIMIHLNTPNTLGTF